MLISGEWFSCPDGIVRPVLRGEIQRADGSWMPLPFLVDIAADCTAVSANILSDLHLQTSVLVHRVGGVGGLAASVVIETSIRFFREDGVEVVFRGQFAAFTDPAALEMSVLGRDITNHFAVIADRPGDVVCLLGQRHYYKIEQQG